MIEKTKVVISLLGTVLDKGGKRARRWNRWRPTVSICQQETLTVDRLVLLYQPSYGRLATTVTNDIKEVSPETVTQHHAFELKDPWDFEEVYDALLTFAESYPFDPDKEEYYLHITTGTHVAQICLFLLAESRYIPAKLLQTNPPDREIGGPGRYQIIDLDLSRYDKIASRFSNESQAGTTFLKGGIETRNSAFNQMIEQLEHISIRSSEPILLTGPTGAGKSRLAQRIYELRRQRGLLSGEFVTVNCATLRGENAMSALFGHKKGAFTGAIADRPGLLKTAHKGLLFLDEIGELGIDEQAMLLRAIEEKRFIPFGADKETSSDFQLIAGTNQDVYQQVKIGAFREDLLARIDLWTYCIPSLKERPDDLEPNLEYELKLYARKAGHLVGFNKAAREKYMVFAISPKALWNANFRDLNASITRMATLAKGSRITVDVVKAEIDRLLQKWQNADAKPHNPTAITESLIGKEAAGQLDLYEHIKLAGIAGICQTSTSMADAGRRLFNVSRTRKSSSNDTHRVKQLLQQYGLTFSDLRDSEQN